jgi:hypothetical protein
MQAKACCKIAPKPRSQLAGLSSDYLNLGSTRFGRHFGSVSLNRCEDALLKYVRGRADEERFWRTRVLAIDGNGGPLEHRAAKLESDLRDYAAERARADATLHDKFGAGAVRMRNLAEYLLAVWTPPKGPRRN